MPENISLLIIGGLLTIVGVLIIWIRQDLMKKIEVTCNEVGEIKSRQQTLEVLVAGDYLTKREFKTEGRAMVEALFKRFDDMLSHNQRLEQKVEMLIAESNAIKLTCARNCKE